MMEAPEDPRWLAIAYGELRKGVRERKGSQDDPSILEYLSATDYQGPLHDEVPWCSAFVCWCIQRAGLASTRGANARSWLAWGEPIIIPRRGCIAIYSRGQNELAGHVGFWLQTLPLPATGTGLHPGADVLLGGNQGDAVSISPYPRNARGRRLLGYRWPSRIGQ
jgi:uncharacterized protein (TIGR02594 family)